MKCRLQSLLPICNGISTARKRQLKRLTSFGICKAYPRHRDDGFALIVVIGVVSLLAAVAIIFTAAVRSYIRTHSAEVGVAEAQALADAGANIAILRLLGSLANDEPYKFDGTPFGCSLKNGQAVTVRVQDEAGKVDLNSAKGEVLRALFSGVGLTLDDAQSKANAVSDFTDRDDDRLLNGGERDDYAAAGRANGPKNSAFETVDELNQVLGLDSDTARLLRPFVTIYSGQEGVDPHSATQELTNILNRGEKGSTEGLLAGDTQSLPQGIAIASVRRVFGIDAEVVTSRGTRFVRSAVVKFDKEFSLTSSTSKRRPPFQVLRWQRGDAITSSAALNAGEFHPC
jgi:hypothetical protein